MFQRIIDAFWRIIDAFWRIIDETSELFMHFDEISELCKHFGELLTKSGDFEGLQGCLPHLRDFRQGGGGELNVISGDPGGGQEEGRW